MPQVFGSYYDPLQQNLQMSIEHHFQTTAQVPSVGRRRRRKGCRSQMGKKKLHYCKVAAFLYKLLIWLWPYSCLQKVMLFNPSNLISVTSTEVPITDQHKSNTSPSDHYCNLLNPIRTHITTFRLQFTYIVINKRYFSHHSSYKWYMMFPSWQELSNLVTHVQQTRPLRHLNLWFQHILTW